MAIICVCVDVLIVFIFMVSLVVAMRWEYLVEFEVEQERLTVRDFSIEVANLPSISQHDLRLEIWDFIERKVLEKTGEPVQIIDIQFAHADNEILFLEMKIKKYTKKEMILKARLNMLNDKARSKESDKINRKIVKTKDKRATAEEKLLRASGKKTVVKAFVTFDYQNGKKHSLETFGISKCRRCCMIGCC